MNWIRTTYTKAVLLLLVIMGLSSCDDSSDYLVKINTAYGSMTVLLYDETPLHKANFLELAKSGRYDSTEWHRIIQGFMVQGGNVNEKEGNMEAEGDQITAEIVDGFMHTKGALAAARQPDQTNPEKKSSACQFYIVDGRVFSEQEMTVDQNLLNQSLSQLLSNPSYDTIRAKFVELQQTGRMAEMNTLALDYVDLCEGALGVKIRKELSPERLEAYTTIGGAPHLDGEYTIFGKVVEGLDVVDKIAAVEVGRMHRPVSSEYMTMEVIEMKKKEITEKYGYEYPVQE